MLKFDVGGRCKTLLELELMPKGTPLQGDEKRKTFGDLVKNPPTGSGPIKPNVMRLLVLYKHWLIVDPSVAVDPFREGRTTPRDRPQ